MQWFKLPVHLKEKERKNKQDQRENRENGILKKNPKK